MKIGELLDYLSQFPEDLEVIVADDYEGSDFSLLADFSIGQQFNETWGKEFTTFDEKGEELDIEECDAVCLWPMPRTE